MYRTNAINRTKTAIIVGALNVADTKLRAAARDVDDRGVLDAADCLEMAVTVRVFARVFARSLAATTAAEPMSGRVLVTIKKHANSNPRNTPHIEGAILALKLAYRLLTMIDDEQTGEAWEVACAVRAAVRSILTSLECCTVFQGDVALDAILNGTASNRRERMAGRTVSFATDHVLDALHATRTLVSAV